MAGKQIVLKLLRLLRAGPRRRDAVLTGCRRFLFLQYEKPLGSAVMATPMFEALREAVPDANVTVACGTMAHQVLRHNPNVDHLVQMRDPCVDLGGAVADMRHLRDRYDCIVTDASNMRTRVALTTLAARGRFRLGFTLAPELYDVPLHYNQDRSVLDNNLDVVGALCHCRTRPEPSVYFSVEDHVAAQSFLHQHNLDDGSPVLAITTQISGGYPEKRRWCGNRFARVAEHFRGKGWKVVFIGTLAEASAIDALMESVPSGAHTAAGKFTVSSLAAFLCRCDLLLTLDTGALHVARGVALPAVVIARPWQAPHEWLPVAEARYCILSKREAVDREHNNPDFSASVTIDEIEVDEVCVAIENLLAHYPAREESRAKRVDARLTTLSRK